MKLRDFKLLADECMHHGVIQSLRDRGLDVLAVADEGLFGTNDVKLLRRAVTENRVVVTHDSDFGTLAILAGEPIVGIVYLRPGHIIPSFTTQTIDAVLEADVELVPPFILVVHRKGGHISMRLRRL